MPVIGKSKEAFDREPKFENRNLCVLSADGIKVESISIYRNISGEVFKFYDGMIYAP